MCEIKITLFEATSAVNTHISDHIVNNSCIIVDGVMFLKRNKGACHLNGCVLGNTLPMLSCVK